MPNPYQTGLPKTPANYTPLAPITFLTRTAGFKVPKKVVFSELPKTSTGKIRKSVLREQAKQI